MCGLHVLFRLLYELLCLPLLLRSPLFSPSYFSVFTRRALNIIYWMYLVMKRIAGVNVEAIILVLKCPLLRRESLGYLSISDCSIHMNKYCIIILNESSCTHNVNNGKFIIPVWDSERSCIFINNPSAIYSFSTASTLCMTTFCPWARQAHVHLPAFTVFLELPLLRCHENNEDPTCMLSLMLTHKHFRHL